MSGVLSKIHQSNALQATDSYSFMALANLGNVLLCLALLLAVCKTHPQLKGREPLFVSGYAVCCAIGNLFCLIALTVLPASVQYPIITGGVIVGATIVSLLKKERPSRRKSRGRGRGVLGLRVDRTIKQSAKSELFRSAILRFYPGLPSR